MYKKIIGFIHKPLRALTVVYKILLKICYCFMWYFSCMYLCILCACLISSETEEVVRVKDCCEQPHVYLGPARAAAKLSLSLPTLSVLISASKSICPSSQAPQSLQDRQLTSGLSRVMLMRMTLTSWEQHSDLLTQTKGEKLGQHI